MTNFLDFTEKNYKKLLYEIKVNFTIKDPLDIDFLSNECIWRHDVDVSPQRSLKLAQIENKLGIKTNYYLMLGCRFYTIFEKEILPIFKEIINLGHVIGLHFDPNLYNINNYRDFYYSLNSEKRMLENILNYKIHTYTLHNPTAIDFSPGFESQFTGLKNVSSKEFVDKFKYCSDSNGIWRHDNLFELAQDKNIKSLYALTHPVWWVPHPLPPRERIKRAINGRSQKTINDYDIDMKYFKRPNI
tara:strand:- start:1312 stop:2043 length:732 start_codon:yes stop_codon:yes gene_type:complete